MKIIKKLAIVGLSLLITASPCFAQTINVHLGNHYWVMDMKMINDDIYIKAKDLVNYFGFVCQYDSYAKEVLLTLEGESLLLDEKSGEAKLINNRIYVPFDVIAYFGGNVDEIVDYMYDSVYPAGGYVGSKGNISVSMYTSADALDMGVVDYKLNGKTLRIEIEEFLVNNYVGYAGNDEYEFDFYQDDDTSDYKQAYNEYRPTYVDVYCNGQFIDCLKRVETYYS